MNCVYEVTTKYSTSKGTTRNVARYRTIAENMNQAIAKTKSYLKKNDMGNEIPDEVRLICELDF